MYSLDYLFQQDQNNAMTIKRVKRFKVVHNVSALETFPDTKFRLLSMVQVYTVIPKSQKKAQINEVNLQYFYYNFKYYITYFVY